MTVQFLILDRHDSARSRHGDIIGKGRIVFQASQNIIDIDTNAYLKGKGNTPSVLTLGPTNTGF